MSTDQLIMQWQRSAQMLESAKREEMELRKQVVSAVFADAKEGTHSFELGNGYKLKAVVKNNYTLGSNDEVDAALKRLDAVGNEGKFIAERLVNWKPSLSLSEYRSLDKKYRDVIDAVLTIKLGAPALELVEPK